MVSLAKVEQLFRPIDYSLRSRVCQLLYCKNKRYMEATRDNSNWSISILLATTVEKNFVHELASQGVEVLSDMFLDRSFLD